MDKVKILENIDFWMEKPPFVLDGLLSAKGNGDSLNIINQKKAN